jgi:hypothetical protein
MSEEKQMGLFGDNVLEEYEKGKDELTMAEFPLAIAGKDSARLNKTSATYQDLIRDKKTGAPVKRVVTIQGSDRFGLPTYYDEEILFGILQLTNLKRSGDDWPTTIRFSRYHLAKILGLKTDGRTYRRIWDSLHRLANTTYNFEFALFDKEDAEWRPSVVINFIQHLIVHGGPVPGKNGEVSIQWNDHIHRNFQAGYLRDINFMEYRSIGLPLAKALYRFLGKHFYRNSRQKFDLKILAYEKLGLSRSNKIGQIKQALDPAIQRLEEHGYIKAVPKNERYVKVSVGRWNVIFEKKTPQNNLPIEVPVMGVNEAKLVDIGVSKGVASQLVSTYPEEVISQKIDEFNFLVAKGNGPNKNPGAWLAKSIKQSWDSPEGYKPEAEREEEKLDEQRQLEQKKAKEIKKRQGRVEYMQISAIRDEWINKTFDSLSEDEMEILTQEVMGEEDRNSEFAEVLLKPLIRAQIAERLENEGKIPPLPAEPD